jgi:putative flippase GtrA
VGEVTVASGEKRSRRRYWRLLSRFALASAVATGISQLVFFVSYSLGSPPTVATVLAWAAGIVPNFVLNQRTWGGSKDALRGQILRYAVISVGTAGLAALATSGTEHLAKALFPDDRTLQVIAVWGAFAGTYAVMFFLKFYLIDRLVFTSKRQAS